MYESSLKGNDATPAGRKAQSARGIIYSKRMPLLILAAVPRGNANRLRGQSVKAAEASLTSLPACSAGFQHAHT